MAVFTTVETDDARAFAARYFPNPSIRTLQGIATGIENTNYFVDVETGEQIMPLVLTLFEMVPDSDIEPVVSYIQHLSAQNLPVPAPLIMRNGLSVSELNGKPAVLVPRVAGGSLEKPQNGDCHAVAATLGRIHLASAGFSMRRPLKRTNTWLTSSIVSLRACLREDQFLALESEAEFQNGVADRWLGLPRGWGHQDLFKDNVLIESGGISGIIDFYHACEDAWIVDLAIMMNDWCMNAGNDGYDMDKLRAAIKGYHEIRPLVEGELDLLAMALRLAALRFWVSRTKTWYQTGYQNNAKSGTIRKDPLEMQKKVEAAAQLSSVSDWLMN